MRLTLAVVVTTHREAGRTLYTCQTMRGAECSAKDAVLSAAFAKLAGKARKLLSKWVEDGKPQIGSGWLYDPGMKGTMLRLSLTLRDRTLRCKLFLISIPVGDRWLAIASTLPDLSFEYANHSELESRATEVYTQWCQKQIKEDNSSSLQTLSIEGDAWLESLEIDIEPRVRPQKRPKNILAALLGNAPVSGAEELHKVGNCLDYMVSDFDTAIGRTQLVNEIEHVLGRRDRQGVLIVGASAVGKSAIFQEFVKRRFARYEQRRGHKPQTWWISPQRLVSGMMYLGQWEQRWLAILREASRRDHILYFEDLVGLYTAGLTRDSRLCAADVLKSFLSEHRVRIVGETTPEELAVLRRRDRALADRFHIVQVPSLSADDCLPVLLEAIQRIETRKDVYFHPAVAPLAIRQQEVLAPNRAFPGKAIELVKAVSDTHRVITPHTLLFHLHRQTGTSTRLLFGNLGNQEQIQYHLSSKVIGQHEAIEAMSRVVVRFTQQLQPNDKPVGVLLFLGPTGVGKTESAKALTEMLFSDASHLIRIDMNEITTPLAAEQLVGTFDAPEGRLTSAVRRQPHSVILLDEIEKAHPDVFDYLLQALGEGRLTDARGRIVDFRSSIVIMTSNLGANQQSGSLGFDKESSHTSQAYVRSAERFFRPEFFNRIDEVIAFRPLESDDIKQIVLLQLRQLLSRDGLKRRHVFVRVEPAALEQVVQIGFDKSLGARAVRRALEREIVQPLGDRLSELQPKSPVLIRVSRESQKLNCQTLELQEQPLAAPKPQLTLEQLLERGKLVLERYEADLSRYATRLKSTEASADFDDQRVAYYTLHEQIFRCSSLLKTARYRVSSATQPRLSPMQGTPAAVRRTAGGWRGPSTRRMLREWMADEDLRETISADGEESQYLDLSAESLNEQLLANLLITDAMLQSVQAGRHWLFGIEPISRPEESISPPIKLDKKAALQLLKFQYRLNPETYFFESLVNCLEDVWQYEVQEVEGLAGYRLVSGVSVSGLLTAILGTYAIEGREHARDLCSLRAIAVPANASLSDLHSAVASAPLINAEGFLLQKGIQSIPSHVIRGEVGEDALDLASGSRLKLGAERMLGDLPTSAEWASWWTGCLPWPNELLNGPKAESEISASQES